MHVLSGIVESVLTVMFLVAGTMKLRSQMQVDAFTHYGYPQWFRVFTGLVEIIGAVGLFAGLWSPVLATWAGLWVAVIMLGAIVTHLRIRDPGRVLGVPITFLILALFVSLVNWSL